MLLTIQILATVSIGIGLLIALMGFEISDAFPNLSLALVLLVASVLIVLIWLIPFAGLIVLISLSIARKIGQAIKYGLDK